MQKRSSTEKLSTHFKKTCTHFMHSTMLVLFHDNMRLLKGNASDSHFVVNRKIKFHLI